MRNERIFMADRFSEAVRKYFVYDTTTGRILHSAHARGKAKAGTIADRHVPNGYMMVKLCVDGKTRGVCSHRVVWFLVNGSWPKEEIDHVDKVRDNNRVDNLRECTAKQNRVRTLRPERDLPRGVSWAGHTNKTNPYIAQIGSKYIGYYATPEAAYQAYLTVFNKTYGDTWKEF